jgi:replication-associated recombination protein RarA
LKDNFLWVEQYRPKTIEECILPEDTKKLFTKLRDKGEIINLLLSGSAGTGKTTVARALCEELGCDYIVINGSETRGIDMVRSTVQAFAGTVSTNGMTKVVILDEADYITPEAQAALRNLIETFSANCRFIFTCNFKSKIIAPLHSRCSIVDFSFDKSVLPQLQVQMAKRTISILAKENVEAEKLAVMEVIKRYSPDNRKILNELQRYANISGKIDSGMLSLLDTSKVASLISFLKSGDFKNCRQWIAENPNPDQLFAEFYDNIGDYVATESIPNLILIMGEYQHRSAFVVNQEINLAAFVVEIMKSVKFK